ncbi:hypothetical protein JCM10449v2_003226 [Rhodotorula kratochvilovae]
MSREYSHRDPSPEHTGEWDTPYARRTTPRATPTPAPSSSSSSQVLTRPTGAPPVLSTLRQEVLPEDEYLEHLSHIIQRDFFPNLRSLEHRNHVLDALDSRDPDRIDQSIRSLRELGTTPTPRRRARESATPLSSRDDHGALTPTYFDRTPLSSFSATPASTRSSSRARAAPPPPRVDPSLSLDAFQARFTSEDNSSFQDLLANDNALRREKHAWAFDAEKRADRRAVRGRQARERLVDVTRRMVDASGDGTVRLLEGPAGRPGEMRLVVDGGVDIGVGDRLLITGRDEVERKLITDGRGADQGKGKGKEVAGPPERIDERAKQFVDYDRPTVDEEEEGRPIDARELQVQNTAWPFKNRNSFMFPPDADRSNPSSLTGPPPLDPVAAASSSSASSSARRAKDAAPVILGEPKGVRHHATRLDALERGTLSSSSARESVASLSPSRSRIGAAIAGTPYPASQSATPRVQGFSFVDALPTLPSSSLPPQALQELMTWGTIEATPVTLRSAGGDADAPGAVGPFRVREADRREELAHRMARRAKRSLADAPSPRGGLALGTGGAGGRLRRTAQEASIRSGAGGGGATPGGATPRARADGLSPAARTLLGRTKPGRALEAGLGRTQAWGEDEEKRRLERARTRAREPSPSVGLGFDPDLPDPLP